MSALAPAAIDPQCSPRARRLCVLALLAIALGGIAARQWYLRNVCPFDLVGDEAHYWDWSRQLDIGYYSKGPAIAWIIRASCAIFGDTVPAVRLPASIFAAGTLICAYWLVVRLFRLHRTALATVVLMSLAPLFAAGSLLMTIDAPMLFAWALATCLLAKVMGVGGNCGFRIADCGLKTPNPQSEIRNPQSAIAPIENRKSKIPWLLLGLIIGLGALAKYGALLWLVLMFIALIADRPSRRWLRTPWPWLATLIAFACLAPPILWNARHDWVSFRHVSRQTGTTEPVFSLIHPLEFLGGQVAIVGPAMFVLMIAGIGWALGSQDRARRFLVWMGMPFFVLVLVTSFRAKVQANWAAPAYFTLAILATACLFQHLHDHPGAWLWRTCLWITVAMGVAVYVMHTPEFLYPQMAKIFKNKKRTLPTEKLIGYSDLGRRVGEIRCDMPGALIIGDDYQTASHLAFYVPGQPKTYCAGAYLANPDDRKRRSQFDVWPDRRLDNPALLGRDAIYVGWITEDVRRAFESVPKKPEEFHVYRAGIKIRTFRIWQCRNFKGLTLPCDHVSH